MKDYDLIVLGSGAGMNLAAAAFERGMRVAVVENGPLGGTCLNRGCIPTKMLTYVADVIMEMRHAEAVNLRARVEAVDFKGLMARMRHETLGESKRMGESVNAVEGLDWYHVTGEFVDDYTMRVGDETIKAPYVFIAAGSRPVIPPIKGLDRVDYLTNKTVLELEEQPRSMVIVGGGFVAVEFAHFFSAIGTEVTIVGRNPRLVKKQDPDVSELLRQELSKRMRVLTGYEVTEVTQRGDIKTVRARNKATGDTVEASGEALLIAAGRRSNADLFKPEKTGVKVDKRGYVIVDEYFQTTKKNIWAFGDAIGRYMFRHTANEESSIVWHNFLEVLEAEKSGREPNLLTMDYHAVPRAIFSYPPIATVGMTLTEARESGRRLLVGQIDYGGAAKGAAMGYPPGFLRVVCDAENGRILGATIIGPHAPILIQEITNVMNCGDGTYVPILRAIHIHPALPELVQRAVGRLAPDRPPGEHAHHH